MSTLQKSCMTMCLAVVVGAGTITWAAGEAGLCSVNKLLGTDVENTAGDKIGDIRELVIKPDTNSAAYAVLGVGGVAGIGERTFAVPLSEFTFQEDRALLSIQPNQLDDLKGFDRDSWPKAASEQWMNDSTYALTGEPANGTAETISNDWL